MREPSAANPDADRKGYLQGTHRVCTPAQTLARLQPLLPRLGITRIANVTGLDRVGIPVALAVRPDARSLSVSQGKGLDLDAARASAAMESIEQWHAERCPGPLLRATALELDARGERRVDVGRLPRAADVDVTGVELFWIQGRDCLGGGLRWVPFECVSADYTVPALPGSETFSASTNGLAGGNTADEALCHALCEVIERDAESLWRLGGARALAGTGVDTGSIRAPAPRFLLERFADAGVAVSIWDLTGDVGVPVYCALALGEPSDWADPEFGAGAHPDPEVALCRALTEAAQARVTFIAGSRDDLGEELYGRGPRARRRAQCEAVARAHRPARDFGDATGAARSRISEDLDWLVERLAGVGISEIVAVPLEDPQLGVPVVRAVVPGLEGPSDHEHCAYVPGERARRALTRVLA